MEQAFLDQAEKHTALGPHYFAARQVAEKFMEEFQNEHFEPLAKKFADEIGRASCRERVSSPV